jgi:hypothetical protein
MRILLLMAAAASFFLQSGSCHKPGAEPELLFDSIPVLRPVQPTIGEVSGIADSKSNPGRLWAHEDSGNPPQLYLIKHDGQVEKRIYIKDVTNRDWEDMALAGSDIYIGEIGDNARAYGEYSIYRFPEPAASVDTVYGAVQFKFRYNDGPHDAEAFVVDPLTRDIYIITKSDQPSAIYKLTFPYSSSSVNTAVPAGAVNYTGVVGAGLSPDGKEIIVKTYTALYHYKRASNETISAALQKTATRLPYVPEAQGESVGFALDNTGFFTLSEKGFFPNVELRWYRRK